MRKGVWVLLLIWAGCSFDFSVAVETEDFPAELVGTFINNTGPETEYIHIGRDNPQDGLITHVACEPDKDGRIKEQSFIARKAKGLPVLLLHARAATEKRRAESFLICKYSLEKDTLRSTLMSPKSVIGAIQDGTLPGRRVDAPKGFSHWELKGSLRDFLARKELGFWRPERTAFRYDPNPDLKPLIQALRKANPDWKEGMGEVSFRSDGTRIVGLQLPGVSALIDISPLSTLKLTSLDLDGTGVSDLRPLKGMAIEVLNLRGTKVVDLSQLQGMPLRELILDGLEIPELPSLPATLSRLEIARCKGISTFEKLQGSSIRSLNLSGTSIRDLSPLRNLPLVRLTLDSTAAEDLSPLKGMSLTTLSLLDTRIKDLKPLQGMPLSVLELGECLEGDLSPLAGMPLVQLKLAAAKGITDIEALQGMPLKVLVLRQSRVRDLKPLVGAPLIELDLMGSLVEELKPLADSQINDLGLEGTQVVDLSPLARVPLWSLDLSGTKVKDLGPLKDRRLSSLNLNGTQVEDLGPLKEMPLQHLWIRGTPAAAKPLPAFLKSGRVYR